MDGPIFTLFLVSIFAGGLVNGLAGFAFALFVSGVWLHLFPPLETTALLVAFGTTVQAIGTWKLRREFDRRHVVPLVIGSVIGTPFGVWLLAYVEPQTMRLSIGALLIAYSLYGLLRPELRPVSGNVAVEVVVGVLNGILGGLGGLTGPVVTVWCSLRGWSKDKQRSVYQPVIFAAFVMAAISLAVSGAFTATIGKLYVIGLPLMLAGMWLGMKAYDYLDDTKFRKIVLGLLLISGLVLVLPIG